MGAIGGLLGTAGGANGTGYKKPGSVPIVNGTDAGQLASSYGSNQRALESQQSLLNALRGQQGIADQSSLYGQQQDLLNQQGALNSVGAQQGSLNSQQNLNAQLAGNNGAANLGNVYGQGQELAGQMAGVGGVQNLNNALQSQQALAGQQQGLANQYQDIASGQGPNPAMAMLNQQTGQNVAQQASLMAGQRGAGSNVGLLARQAGQQGAGIQQQAVGQGATMQAQQSLNALQGIGNQQQAIGNTNQNVANIAAQQIGQQQQQQQALAGQAGQQIGFQQAGINSAQQAASGLTAQQMAQQAALAGQANTMAGQQIGATTTNTQAQQSEQGILQNSIAAQNNAKTGMQGNVNQANAGLASKTMEGQQGLIGGVLNAAGAAAKVGLAGGGEVSKSKKFADGGIAPPPVQVPVLNTQPSAPKSSWGRFLQSAFTPQQQEKDQGNFNLASSENKGAQALQKGAASFGSALVSALKPSTPASSRVAYTGSDIGGSSTQMVAAKGGMAKKDYTSGGNVKASSPSQKAEKPGNSYDNDKIPAVLSEGEVVIPRSVMQSADPAKAASAFVAQVLAKRRR